MISALLYLQYHSVKNRLVARFKRLKQPKYLAGAVVGALYFYVYFFRYLFFPRGRLAGSPLAAAVPGDAMLYESMGALVLFVLVLTAWVFPHKRAALSFTEAEVAFLFPAPVTRRSLIHFRLLRSQAGILFSVLFLTLVFNRFGSGGRGLFHAAGWWLALSTLALHTLGSSFARTMLLDRGITNWQRRLAVLSLVVVLAGVVGVWVARTLPELTGANLADLDQIRALARRVLVSGPLPYLLYPFRLVVRPYFAADAPAFLNALWPVLLILAAHYAWVVRSDVAFEEASVEASKKLAGKIAAARAGHWQSAGKQFKRKRAPFNLAPVGALPIALLWKNLIAAGQGFTRRVWITLALVVIGVSAGLRGSGAASNWLPAVGAIAGMLGVWAVLLGPQVVRQDFRHDLPRADLLKLYPLRGWQVALGEILAPAVILTGIQWLLLLLAVAFLLQVEVRGFNRSLVFAIGLGAAFVLPMLNLISLLIPNAAVLLFPAWFQTGTDAPRGLEATGQRLIFALGQLLAFVLVLLPAGGAFAVAFFIVQFAAGAVPAVLAAALAAAFVLAAEAGLGILLLGWLFTRFDVSSEPGA